MRGFYVRLATAGIALVASGLAVAQQVVDYDFDGIDESTICQARIAHGQADCLEASWDNPGGGTYSVKNLCSDYGTLRARVTIEQRANAPSDYRSSSATIVLDNSTAYTFQMKHADITNIYCCQGESDICHRSQVEADSDGNITSLSVSGSTVTETEVDVSTYPLRYEFCSENPDDIYCEVDPEGDANQTNCGDHVCGIGDCTWHWERSPADDYCWFHRPMTFVDGGFHSPQCQINASCRKLQKYSSNSFEVTEYVWNVDDLVYCSADYDDTGSTKIFTTDASECLQSCGSGTHDSCVPAPSD